MPCGYLEPSQKDNTAFLMMIMIIGASGFVVLLAFSIGLSCYCQRLKRLKLNPLYGIDVQAVLKVRRNKATALTMELPSFRIQGIHHHAMDSFMRDFCIQQF